MAANDELAVLVQIGHEGFYASAQVHELAYCERAGEGLEYGNGRVIRDRPLLVRLPASAKHQTRCDQPPGQRTCSPDNEQSLPDRHRHKLAHNFPRRDIALSVYGTLVAQLMITLASLQLLRDPGPANDQIENHKRTQVESTGQKPVLAFVCD